MKREESLLRTRAEGLPSPGAYSERGRGDYCRDLLLKLSPSAAGSPLHTHPSPPCPQRLPSCLFFLAWPARGPPPPCTHLRPSSSSSPSQGRPGGFSFSFQGLAARGSEEVSTGRRSLHGPAGVTWAPARRSFFGQPRGSARAWGAPAGPPGSLVAQQPNMETFLWVGGGGPAGRRHGRGEAGQSLYKNLRALSRHPSGRAGSSSNRS